MVYATTPWVVQATQCHKFYTAIKINLWINKGKVQGLLTRVLVRTHHILAYTRLTHGWQNHKHGVPLFLELVLELPQ